MKKILVALTLTILILTSFAVLAVPHVKADTTEAKVLSYSWYVAPDDTLVSTPGDLIVVGEIQNVGSNILGEVVVSGYAYNSSDTLLNTAEAQAFGTGLSNGQLSPFYLDFTPDPTNPNPDPNWAYSVTNVTVIVSYVTDTNITYTSGLTIPTGDTSGSLSSSGVYTLSGFIQNNGTQASGPVWVVTTFYNASGTVVSLNYTANYISESLSPGARATFLATPVDNNAELSSSITNYSVLIQSLPLSSSATPTPTQPTSQTTSTTTASTNPSQSPGTISLGTLAESVIAVVVVLVILVAIVFLLFIRKRKKTDQLDLPPPPPPPPPE